MRCDCCARDSLDCNPTARVEAASDHPIMDGTMATILEEILNSFYAKLSESPQIDEATLEALRALFSSGEKLKADDIVNVLAGAKEKETRGDPD